VASDYYLTTHVYNFPFAVQGYLLTWAWYAAVIVLGGLLLSSKTSIARVASATVLASTSFFVASNYAVWVGSGMYPHSVSGLMSCYAAGLPFYRNDLVSTAIVAGLAFGVPQLLKQHEANKQAQTL
jgi:biotin transporter BioY